MHQVQTETSGAHLRVDFLIERRFLQLQFSFGVGHLGVSLEFDVHHLFLAFCFLGDDKGAKQCSVGCCAQQNQSSESPPCSYPYPSIPLCLRHADVCIPLDSCSLGFPEGAQIIQFIIHILREKTDKHVKL